MKSAIKLAKIVIDRCMPHNAGGVHVIMMPKLAETLLPFFARKTDTKLKVDTNGSVPLITEVTSKTSYALCHRTRHQSSALANTRYPQRCGLC